MKFLLALLLLAVPVVASADDVANCTSVSRTAELVMQSRQSNIDPAVLIKAVEPTDTHGVARALILDAYTRPLMRSIEGRLESVNTFRNDAFVVCMQATKP